MNEPVTSTVRTDVEWIPVAQAAVLLGFTERHVRRLCVAGSIEARRDGGSGRWAVSAAAVADLAVGEKLKSGHDGPGSLDVRTSKQFEREVAPRAVDTSGAATFDELERFALQSEIAQLRLQLQAMTGERDQARRDEARALMLASAHRQAFDTLSDASLAPVGSLDT